MGGTVSVAAAAAKSCASERTPDLAGVTARTRTVLYGGGIVHTQTEQTSNHQAMKRQLAATTLPR